MASAARFYYPTETGSTASWLPAVCPSIPAEFGRPLGIIQDVMADGVTTYSDEIGSDIQQLYRLLFPLVTDAERTSLETFFTAAKGRTFQLREPANDALVTVVFDFAEMGSVLPWRYNGKRGKGPWEIELVMRRVA